MVCQDSSVEISHVSHLKNFSPATVERITTTNPFLPGYCADIKPPEKSGTPASFRERDPRTIVTVEAKPRQTSLFEECKDCSREKKPMAKVLPMRREVDTTKPYPSHPTVLPSTRQQHKARQHSMGPVIVTLPLHQQQQHHHHHRHHHHHQHHHHRQRQQQQQKTSELKSLQEWMNGHYYKNDVLAEKTTSSKADKRAMDKEADDDDDLHSMPENYHNVIGTYSRVCGYDASKDMILKRAYHLLEESHIYYGDMGAEAARQRLKKHPDGSFLLRDSSDRHFLFSLSIKTNRGVTAIRIAYRSGVFALDCEENMARRMPSFTCIFELLQFYMMLTKRTIAHNENKQQNKNNMCVFLEMGTGRRDTAVALHKPAKHSVPSLKKLARLALNQMLSEDQRYKLLLFMPPNIEQFMTDYPYLI